MDTKPSGNILDLQSYPGGVGNGIRQSLLSGRYEIVTAGPNPEFGYIGSDPYQTNAFTGLVVPATPSSSLAGSPRYLFVLARATFGSGEVGTKLVGIRQYAELVARIPILQDGSQTGQTTTYRKEIKSPLWHLPDGNISWHVMVSNRQRRDTRNPQNTDGLVYEDSFSPALLYETFTGTPFLPTVYTPPNGGRPWGRPIAASLGNIHELRYKWRTDQAERPLEIYVPVPCDVVLFASVRQNDPTTNPVLPPDACSQFSALSPEDQFLVTFNTYAQYGSIAGALVFEENLEEDNI